MKPSRALAAFTGVLLSVSACDSLLTRPSLYGAVDVRVTRRNGDAISGASLVLYTFQRPMAYATTDAAGSYRFTTVPEGLYGVGAVPPPGYTSVSDTLNTAWDFVDQLAVRSGGTVEARLHFVKQGYGVVVAQVTEFGGPPVAQVPVTLRGPSALQRAGITDATGRFAFDSVPAGSYAVTALRSAAYLDSGAVPLLVHDGVIVEDGTRDTVGFAFVPRRSPVRALVRRPTAPPPTR